MKKTLNITLFLSFIVTIMAPITGIYIHKLAAAVFLLYKYYPYNHLSKKNKRKAMAAVGTYPVFVCQWIIQHDFRTIPGYPSCASYEFYCIAILFDYSYICVS